MRIYYLNFRHVLKRAVVILIAIAVLGLTLKIVQYNLFKPAVSNFEPIYQGDAAQKKIALTCNVVWGEEYIPQLLEVLKKNNTKMTFFMGGQWVEKFPELTRQIAQGHELGNHSYSHPHPTFISKKENVDEIKRTEQTVYKTTGITTHLYAPPYGEYNNTVLDAAGESGYKIILWSIDTRDWQNPSPEEIISRVVDKAHNGAIVLMHPTAPTVKALPGLISELKETGYTVNTVSEVIHIR